MLVTLEDSLTLIPMETVLDFNEEDEAFLILEHTSWTTYRVKAGHDVASKFSRNGGENKSIESTEVAIRTIETNRNLLHVIETMKAPERKSAEFNDLQLTKSPPNKLSPVGVEASSPTIENALQAFYKLSLDQAVKCMYQKFGEETLFSAFSNILKVKPAPQTETKASLPMEIRRPSTSTPPAIIATSDANNFFDPLNTPCSSSRESPVSNRSGRNSILAQQDGTMQGKLSSKVFSDMSSMESAELGASDRVSRRSDDTEFSSGTSQSSGTSSSVKIDSAVKQALPLSFDFDKILEIAE